MAVTTTGAHLSLLIGRLLDNCAASVRDLTADELHFRAAPAANSIGFEMWHLARTVDNVVFFAFDREPPVWLRDGYDQRFGLPRTAQGTGMPTEEA